MQIATIANIPVRLHASFWILGLGYAALEGYQNCLEQMLTLLILFVMLFSSVVLHEFGHALAARRLGIKTESITLYPFGGIARMGDISHHPKQEMTVALAGPAVNIAISAVAGITWWNLPSPPVGILAALNIAMALFNLIPAYPMDGGRVLRSALSLRLGHTRATTISLSVGRWCAYGFLIGSIPAQMYIDSSASWGLAFVGVFLLFSHQIERRQLQRSN